MGGLTLEALQVRAKQQRADNQIHHELVSLMKAGTL
jgi:hypothetical protein